MMNKIMIGLPCYNEEKDINQLLTRVLNLKEKIKTKFGLEMVIFCVNDGSKDKTEEIIKERKKEGIYLINHDINKGLGEAMRTIFMEFISKGTKNDYLIVMDSDNSHNPNYIIKLIEKQIKNKCDIVIASRYQAGAKIKGLKKYRMLLSDFVKIWYSLMLRISNVKNYTSGYRLYTYNIVEDTYKKYNENMITQTSFACMMEILYKMHLTGASIDEIPFMLEYNLKVGTSKMKILKTSVNSLITTLKIKRLGEK